MVTKLERELTSKIDWIVDYAKYSNTSTKELIIYIERIGTDFNEFINGLYRYNFIDDNDYEMIANIAENLISYTIEDIKEN